MNFQEKTLKSEQVYDGRIVKVFKDNVELSDGQKAYREVVKHSGGVVILAYKDSETILFVRQFRYPMKEVMLELPAGKLEYGEDPFVAAKRELEEETGYQAKKWTELGYVYTSPGYSDEKLYLYKAEDLTYTKQNLDEGEILEPLEMSYDEVLKKINDNEIVDAKTLCAILRGNIL